MHILKPIYSLLNIYLRINRDHKSPQKSVTGFLYFFFFFLKNTELEMMMVTVQLGTVCPLPTGAVFLSVSPLQPQSYTKSKLLTNFLGSVAVRNKQTNKKTLQKVKIMHWGRKVSARQLKSVMLICCYSQTSLCGYRFITHGKTLCNAPLKEEWLRNSYSWLKRERVTGGDAFLLTARPQHEAHALQSVIASKTLIKYNCMDSNRYRDRYRYI